MSLTELHKRKRTKNFAMLAMILGWCALIWAVVMVRMGG